MWSSSHSGVMLQEPGPSVDQEATQRLRTALWVQRIEALHHTHASDKRDGTSGKGNDGRTAARTHTDGLGAVLHASYGHAG